MLGSVRRLLRRTKWDLAPHAAVGIAFGTDAVAVARLEAAPDGWHLREAEELGVGARLFQGAADAATVQKLSAVVRERCADISGQYVPVHVSVPDAAVSAAVFALDELPKTPEARLELIRWRFGRELFHDGERYHCTGQVLGQDGGKFLLLGLAMDEAWRECLAQTLHEAGVVPWSMGPAVVHQFNRYYGRLTPQNGQGGALLTLALADWALLIWDAGGRARLIRGRWRDSSAGEHAAIAEESQRLILACVHGAGLSVGRLYVAGPRAETRAVAQMLDGKLRDPCVVLDPAEGLAAGDTALIDRGLFPPAISAALGWTEGSEPHARISGAP